MHEKIAAEMIKFGWGFAAHAASQGIAKIFELAEDKGYNVPKLIREIATMAPGALVGRYIDHVRPDTKKV